MLNRNNIESIEINDEVVPVMSCEVNQIRTYNDRESWISLTIKFSTNDLTQIDLLRNTLEHSNCSVCISGETYNMNNVNVCYEMDSTYLNRILTVIMKSTNFETWYRTVDAYEHKLDWCLNGF